MSRLTPLKTSARLVAVSVCAGVVAYALRMLWPWLGQLDQGAVRRYLEAGDSSPFLIVEVPPNVPSKQGLPAGDGEIRGVYADLVTKLERGGAKGIVFDIQFKDAGPAGPSRQLEQAIGRSSIPIVVPAIETYKGAEGSRFERPRFLPDDSPAYYGSARGHPEEGIADLVGGDEVEPFFHIAVLAAAVAHGLDPYEDVDWHEGRLTVGRRAIPADRNGRLLLPAAGPTPVFGLEEVLGKPEIAREKVVFIGRVRGTDRHATPFGTLEGVEFVARVAAAVYSPTPRILAPGWASLLVAVLLAGLTTVSMLGLRPLRSAVGVLAALSLAWLVPAWLSASIGPTSPVSSLLAILLAAILSLSGEGFGLRRRVYGRVQPIDEDATVMFVDLVGSTALVRALGPSKADRVMHVVVQSLTDAVERLGAEIERPLGDGVLVHWRGGEPADQVVRCLDALPQIRRALTETPLPDLPKDFLPELTFGIEHGRIAGSPVTVRGLPQWMSSGETVHLAARLQGKCGELGRVCLLGPVAGELAGSERVTPVGEVELKGFGSVVVFAPR